MNNSVIADTRIPSHPGAILREDVLPTLGLSVTAFARSIHVSRQTVHGILAEKKGLTPEMALRVGKFLGNGPGLWLRMQQAYDLALIQKQMSTELESIHTAEHAA